MPDGHTATPITRRVLDAFPARAPDLDGVAAAGRVVTYISFELAGTRLDLLTDDGAPHTFVLALPSALHIDEAAYPGALAKTLELIHLLHGEIHYVAGAGSGPAP